MVTVTLIAALSENRVIGRRGELPWHLPEDLRRFKRRTTGRAVIMGRKTFDAIGRPLPNRRTVIITRDREFRADGADVVHDLDAALDRAAEGEVFIAGGGAIYALAMPRADKLDLTIVHSNIEGDTFFPVFDPSAWTLREDTRHPTDPQHAYAYSFRTYDR